MLSLKARQPTPDPRRRPVRHSWSPPARQSRPASRPRAGSPELYHLRSHRPELRRHARGHHRETGRLARRFAVQWDFTSANYPVRVHVRVQLPDGKM